MHHISLYLRGSVHMYIHYQFTYKFINFYGERATYIELPLQAREFEDGPIVTFPIYSIGTTMPLALHPAGQLVLIDRLKH